MSKTLDWSKIYKGGFDDNRRKQHGQMTSREALQRNVESLKRQEEMAESIQKSEVVLKSALLEAMVSQSPIRVLRPFQNPTESLNGLIKSDQDDEFPDFYNSSPSFAAHAGSTASAKFVEVMETVPAGINLIYKSWDKTLGQWIFEGSNGEHYAIYSADTVRFSNSIIQNPGLKGLLFNTNLSDRIEE